MNRADKIEIQLQAQYNIGIICNMKTKYDFSIFTDSFYL